MGDVDAGQRSGLHPHKLVAAQVEEGEREDGGQGAIVERRQAVPRQGHLRQRGGPLEEVAPDLLQRVVAQVERLQRREDDGGGGDSVDGVAAQVEMAQGGEGAAGQDAGVEDVEVVVAEIDPLKGEGGAGGGGEGGRGGGVVAAAGQGADPVVGQRQGLEKRSRVYFE